MQAFLQKEIKPTLTFDAIEAKNKSKDAKYEAAHLRIGFGVIKDVVLTVGDPFRCEVVAKLCDKATEIAWNREYRIYNVVFEGTEMTVVSHGIGGPGAAICFEELIQLGATTIIRMGTCGSMQKHIRTGDLIVSTSSCREDGHSQFIMPQGFPAVADPLITLALYEQAKTFGYNVHMGVNLTSGLFYPGPAIPDIMKVNADAGALSVEMENATLFCIGTARGIRTAAIGTVDGYVFGDHEYDPHGDTVKNAKERMILTGLRVGKRIVMESAAGVDSTAAESKDASLKSESAGDSIFSPEQTQHCSQLFMQGKLYDYVEALEKLNNVQKAQIFDLSRKGVASNLQFTMVSTMSDVLTEVQMEDIITLFYKLQHNKDGSFTQRANAFIDTYGEKSVKDQNGPKGTT